jgi:hypothetical protein
VSTNLAVIANVIETVNSCEVRFGFMGLWLVSHGELFMEFRRVCMESIAWRVLNGEACMHVDFLFGVLVGFHLF